MRLDDLIQEERAIRQLISETYVDPTGKALPVYDGVVDPEQYIAAPARILWVLKEPWDEDDFSGGGWSISQNLLREKTEEMARGKTFLPIVYLTYGILNRVWRWADIPDINIQPPMAFLLQSIAFINARKLPGPRCGSKSPQILEAYNKARHVIMRQIAAYKPNYIFGCRPHMSRIMDDLGIRPDQVRWNGSARYANNDDCMFFDIYHPNQRTISQEKYVDEILQIIFGVCDSQQMSSFVGNLG